jgi:hypothetical protein
MKHSKRTQCTFYFENKVSRTSFIRDMVGNLIELNDVLRCCIKFKIELF